MAVFPFLPMGARFEVSNGRDAPGSVSRDPMPHGIYDTAQSQCTPSGIATPVSLPCGL